MASLKGNIYISSFQLLAREVISRCVHQWVSSLPGVDVCLL